MNSRPGTTSAPRIAPYGPATAGLHKMLQVAPVRAYSAPTPSNTAAPPIAPAVLIAIPRQLTFFIQGL